MRVVLKDTEDTRTSLYRINGGAFTVHQETTWDFNATTWSVAGTTRPTPIAPFVLAAGTSAVIDFQLAFICSPQIAIANIPGLFILNHAAAKAVGRTL
jgi:hypothetical protein